MDNKRQSMGSPYRNTKTRRGVCKHTQYPGYIAHISVNGNRKTKYCKTYDEAIKQREEWENEFQGFQVKPDEQR